MYAQLCFARFPWRDYDADTGRFTALDPLREKGGDTDWYGYCVDDPVNRVDVLGLFSWNDVKSAVDPTTIGNIISNGATAVTKLVADKGLIGPLVSKGLGWITAPLGDFISPDNASGVYEETKEYWDKRNSRSEPDDLRDQH